MTSRNRVAAVLTAGGFLLGGLAVAAPASQASGLFENCTALHTRWAHGVGRLHAHDHTSGTPVTNFKHSNRLYRKAMNHNAQLDADGDKIACEAA